MRPLLACARRLDADRAHTVPAASSQQRQRAPCTFGPIVTALDAVAQTHRAVLVGGLWDASAAAPVVVVGAVVNVMG